jgi:hypothetical protein
MAEGRGHFVKGAPQNENSFAWKANARAQNGFSGSPFK